MKEDSKPYQVPLKCRVNALQKPFKEEVQWLQQLDMNVVPLGVEKTADWCNSFVLVTKPNGKICFCLDPSRLNQILIRLVHTGPTVDNIFPKLMHASI